MANKEVVVSNYQYHDGGRMEAGFKGISGDCGIRAMAIACQIPYVEARKRCKDVVSAYTGSKAVYRGIYKTERKTHRSLACGM